MPLPSTSRAILQDKSPSIPQGVKIKQGLIAQIAITNHCCSRVPKLRCRNKQITRQQSSMSSIGFKPKCRVRMMMLAGDNESALQIHTYIHTYCSVLHLRHLPSTAPGSHVALAAPAEGWRLSWLLFFVFQFHIFFRRRAADPFFFQHKGNKENSQHLPTTPQRAHLLHLGHLLHVPPTAPMAPAAPASYCTYGTCCTCLLYSAYRTCFLLQQTP